MSKIICDICGTSYPETADCCPICGCTRDTASSLLGDELIQEETVEEPKAKSGAFASKKKEIFDYDEVNDETDYDDEEEEDDSYDEDEDDEDEEEGPRHNVFVVILLTVVIFALLAAAGFLFVRYFLPNMGGEKDAQETTVPQFLETTEAPTTIPGVPCQTLSLSSGAPPVLSQEGQYFLLHVITIPEDTTDPIVYTSSDESVVTVTEDGRLTAVAEGEAVVYITCGNVQLPCSVTVRFEEETQPPTEETEPVTEPAETGETQPEGSEETAPAEETKAPAPSSDVELKLKKTDISLGVYYQFQLVLDCELEQNQVQWSSEHPHIATVDENGVVTAVKAGTTSITAKYGDQEVFCIVRCSW